MVQLKDILHAIMKYLGIGDGEAQVRAFMISDELQNYYELSPGSMVNKSFGKLSKQLEAMQRRIMKGEDLSEDIEGMSKELQDAAAIRNLAFEDSLRLEYLKKKLEYIKSWNMVNQCGRQLRDKENELRSKVSEEVWALYLDIEELQRELNSVLVGQALKLM